MRRRRLRSPKARRRLDSLARRARAGGGVQFPHRREARYLATIEARVVAARDLVVGLLSDYLGQLASEPQEIAAARGDARRADADLPGAGPSTVKLPEVVDLSIAKESALLRMVDTAKLGRARLPPDEGDLLDVAKGVDTFTTDQVSRVVDTVVGINPSATGDLAALHKAWAKTNAGLITSIDARFFNDIAKEVSDAVAMGRSTKALGEAIEARTGVATRRARLIARDQVATLNGQITKARQEAVGVSRYEWSTSKDERVRDEHADREGVIFPWSQPPPDGHPGEPINCRCVAIPVFDTVEGVIEEGSIGGPADFPIAATGDVFETWRQKALAELAETRAPRMRAAVEAGDLAAVEVIESETAAGRIFGAPEAAKMRQRQEVPIPRSLVSLDGASRVDEQVGFAVDATNKRFRSFPPGFIDAFSKREGTTLVRGKAVKKPWGVDMAPSLFDLQPDLRGADLLKNTPMSGGKLLGVSVGPRGFVGLDGGGAHLISHTAIHEAAHGVDDILKGLSGRPPFRALYKEHKGAIAAWDKEREFGNGAYYLQADHVGPSEFFAEIMADSTEDFRRELLDKHFPGLLEGVAKAIEDSL